MSSLKNMSDRDLLTYVDRSNEESKELATRLEALITAHQEMVGELQAMFDILNGVRPDDKILCEEDYEPKQIRVE